MASDFVKLLRPSAGMAGRDPEKYLRTITVAEANAIANHIETLEAEVERLTAALQTIVDKYDAWPISSEEFTYLADDLYDIARAALAEQNETEGNT